MKHCEENSQSQTTKRSEADWISHVVLVELLNSP